MTHPAFEKAPKTLREALTIALKFAKRSKNYGHCLYVDGRKICIIGNFFTKDQLNWIVRENKNPTNVGRLVEVIGAKNLRAMTCMTADQAVAIQSIFDYQDGKEQLVASLENVLSQGRAKIKGIEFKL